MGSWDGTAYGVAKNCPKALYVGTPSCFEDQQSNIVVCNAAIPNQYLDQYKALFENFSQWMIARKRSHEEVHDASVATLLAKCGIMVS